MSDSDCRFASTRLLSFAASSTHVHMEIARLREWCITRGIRIDPRLEIRESDGGGICVFTRAEAITAPGTTRAWRSSMPNKNELTISRLASRVHTENSGAVCQVQSAGATYPARTLRAWRTSCALSSIVLRAVSGPLSSPIFLMQGLISRLMHAPSASPTNT